MGHVGIEIEFALLDQLHHGRPGEEFAHRSDSEERPRWIDRLPAFDIRIAVPFGEEQGAILYDGDCGSRHVLVSEVSGHHAV
jgi:hypothetical protein